MRASDRILKLSGFAGVIGIIALTAGCGGGGGSSAPSSNSTSFNVTGLKTLPPGAHSALPVNNQMIPLKPGDQWLYAYNGFKNAGGKISHVVQAAYLRTTNDAGGGLIGVTDAWKVVYDDNSYSFTNLTTNVLLSGGNYLEFSDNADKDGNFESTGNNPCEDLGAIDPATGLPYPQAGDQAVPLYPGTWVAGTGLSGSAAFNVPDGTTKTPPNPVPAGFCIYGSNLTNQESASFTLVDKETITVPAGTFDTWKVQSTRRYVTQGQNYDQTAWWAPQIGSFVQMTEDVSDSSTGTTGRYTYQLVGWETN